MSSSIFRSPGDDAFRAFPAAHPFTRHIGGLRALRRAKAESAIQETEPDPGPAPIEEQPAGAAIRMANALLGPAGTWHFRDQVAAMVDVTLEGPSRDLAIGLELWGAFEGEPPKRIHTRSGAVGRDGKARTEFVLDPPDGRRLAGRPDIRGHYFLRATHREARSVDSPILEVVPDASGPFTGVVYYSPLRDEYLILPDEEATLPFFAEVRQVEGLRAKSQAAWALPDASRRVEALEEVEAESESLFGGGTTGDGKGALEELLLVQDSRKQGEVIGWVYVPAGDKEGNRFPRYKRSEAVNERNRLLKHGGQYRKNSLEGKIKARLWKAGSKSWPKGDLRTYKDKDDGQGDYFTWTREAAMGRFFCGWDGGQAGFDPKKKTFKVGSSGNLTASAFEGKVTGSLDFPDVRGGDILRWLRGVKYGSTYVLDPGRACLLKLTFTGELSAFLGAQLQAALTFPSLSFKDISTGKLGAEVGGSLNGFAGIQLKGGVSGGMQWASAAGAPFQELGSIGIDAGASGGLGGGLQFKVEFKEGRFRFQFSTAMAYMLGFKAGFAWDVGLWPGLDLIGHLLDCVDFHFVKELLGDAYEIYAAHSSLMLLSEARRNPILRDWHEATQGWAERGAESIRRYFFSRQADSLALKAALKKEVGNRKALTRMAPEALGLALAKIMETREESDFLPIQYILGSTVWRKDGKARQPSPDHKLKWVLRYINGIPDKRQRNDEGWKKEALEKGMRKVREFGNWKLAGKSFLDEIKNIFSVIKSPS